MDANLLLGALLVGVGLALAALAYSLITERVGAETEDETPSESESKPQSPAEVTDSEVTMEDERDDQPVSEPDTEDEPLPSPEGEVEPATDEAPDEIEEEFEGKADLEESDTETAVSDTEAPSRPPDDQPVTESKSEPPKQRPTFPVATLMRDEVSGELVIKVGDKTYRDKEELEASKDWSRVRYAADDLAKWIEGEPSSDKPVPSPPTPRPSSGKVERGKEAETPRSMVEQIDEILQELLVETSHAERAVRLMEGPDGTARVLIGIDNYSIEEVPDDEIQELIKQAVAEWEAAR
jgi:hypothetical protein